MILSSVPDPMDVLLNAVKSEYGSEIVTGDEDIYSARFVEVYPIVLQWMLDNLGFRLGTLITLAGKQKSYKTSAALELANLSIDNPGGLNYTTPGRVFVIDTEGKWSSSKARGLLGDRYSRMSRTTVTDVQEMQRYMTKIVGTANKEFSKVAYKDLAAREALPPLSIVLDSMSGGATESVNEATRKEGYASKGYPEHAILWSNWLKSQVTPWSEMVVPPLHFFTNHLKQDISATGYGTVDRMPGGASIEFHSAVVIYTKRFAELNKGGYTGAKLSWQCWHNSLGQDRRSIDIECRETYRKITDAETGEEQIIPISYYAWDAALIPNLEKICDSFSNKRDKQDMRDRLESVLGKFGVKGVQGVGSVAWCESIGIVNEADARAKKVSPDYVGRMIQTNPELRRGLQDALYIQRYKVWGNTDDNPLMFNRSAYPLEIFDGMNIGDANAENSG